MLSAGHGINAGMMAWGDRMLKFTGRARADPFLDAAHSTIGFWTDNGGYYHYSTGVNKSATYEEVLPKVRWCNDSAVDTHRHFLSLSWLPMVFVLERVRVWLVCVVLIVLLLLLLFLLLFLLLLRNRSRRTTTASACRSDIGSSTHGSTRRTAASARAVAAVR